MKILLTLLAFLVTNFCLSQKQSDLKNNILAFETGIWSRGLAGVSYTRNYCKQNWFFLAADASYGIGGNPKDKAQTINHHVVISQAINFGKRNSFFYVGVEGRFSHMSSTRTKVTSSWGVPNGTKNATHYFTGVTGSPVIGTSNFNDRGLSFKTRISSQLIHENGELIRWRPSFGISIGYMF